MTSNMEDGKCGLGSCQPTGLQRCARLIVFTIIVSINGLFIMMQGPLFVSQVTSIERQFGINSTQMGALMSANDIGFLILVLFVSHFAKDAHAPRLLGFGSLLFGVSCLCIAAMNFVEPHSLPDELELSSNSSQPSVRDKAHLCVPDMSNHTSGQGCSQGDAASSAGNVPVVVVIGLFLGLQGATKAIRSPLGVTYIDNNVSDPSRTGLHVGIMLTLVLVGPPLGFALGGYLSQIPVDLSDTPLKTTDPRWVGGWWIGLMVAGFLVTVSTIPLFCFPRRLPEAGRKQGATGDGTSKTDRKGSAVKNANQTEDKAPQVPVSYIKCKEQTDANGTVHPTRTKDNAKNGTVPEVKFQINKPEDSTALSLLKEMPLSLLRLVKNPLYVVLILALGINLFGVIGFSSFLIKFVERQFGLPPWMSSYVFGLSNLVLGGLGTYVGGALVSRCHLTRRGCLRWIAIAGFVSTVMSAVTLELGCDGGDIVGLTHREYELDDGINTCQCALSQFLPVCDGNTTFLSPCHAGCTAVANSTHFQNCTAAATREVSLGVCSPGCHLLIPFIIMQVLTAAVGATVITPLYVTILRTVPEKDKTLGVGLLSFILSLVAFIPAPIVFGAVIDSSCLIWSSSCGSNSGACAFYDISRLRHGYIGLETGLRGLASIFFVIALVVLMWQVRTGRTTDDKPVQEKAGIHEITVEAADMKKEANGSPIIEVTRL